MYTARDVTGGKISKAFRTRKARLRENAVYWEVRRAYITKYIWTVDGRKEATVSWGIGRLIFELVYDLS